MTEAPKELQDASWLIQRVKVRKFAPGEESKPGVDGYFRFSYMGAAEFGYGALPEALKRMRESRKGKKTAWSPKEIKVDNHVCWFVGPSSIFETACAFFADQLKPAEARLVRYLKERSEIRRNFLGAPEYATNNVRDEEGFPSPMDYAYCDAWWSIGPTPFLLFRQKEHAELWLKCL